MEFKDSAIAKGFLELWKMPAEVIRLTTDMLLHPEKYGVLLNKGDNLVVDVGRQVTARMMAGEIPNDPVTTFCVGTGGYTSPPVCGEAPNPPLGTDTDLYALVDSRALSSITHPNIAANTYGAIITSSELNGYEFSEWGLKTASGILYSRRTTKPYPKEASFALVAKWTIQH